MNAAAANGDDTGASSERDRLLSELSRLREQRDQAIRAANELQKENVELKRRIKSLEEGPSPEQG